MKTSFFLASLVGIGLFAPNPGIILAQSNSPQEEQQFRQAILEKLLSTPDTDTKKGNDLLLIHGPLLADEVPYLEKQIHHGNANIRYQATQLLTLVRPNDDVPKIKLLHTLVHTHPDLLVFATALRFFLNDPHPAEGIKLAAIEREKVKKALISQDPNILAVGIQAGTLLQLPEVKQVLPGGLFHPNDKVRQAVLDSLKRQGPASLEPALKKILLHPPQGMYYDVTSIYEILSKSDDPAMAQVFQEALAQGKVDHQTGFLNGIFFSASRKPWLKTLLFSLMAHSEQMRWSAFGRLADWGPEVHKELVRFCQQAYQQAPAIGSDERRRYVVDLEPCREFLAKLAGREKFGSSEDEIAKAVAFSKDF